VSRGVPQNGGVIDRDPFVLRVLSALTSGVESANTVAARVGVSSQEVAALLEHGVVEGLVSRLDLAGTPVYQLTPKGLEVVGVAQGVESAVDDRGHVDLGAAARMVMEQYQAAKDVAAEDTVRDQAAWPADDATRDRVSAALNDAFARGALTKEQLDERTNRALTATTMGEVRAAGEGVIELPAALPTGVDAAPTGTAGWTPPTLQVNPAVKQVTWRHVGYAALYVVVGLFFLLFLTPLVGLLTIAAGLLLGGFALRPILRSGNGRIRTP
jgi:Domain of unknown function (DUF1707)